MASTGDEALGALIDASHTLEPDRLVDVVAAHAEPMGLGALRLYLADKEQRVLMPLGVDDDPLEIDATLAGRAFRRVEDLEGDGFMWFPLLNGTHRVGVLRAKLPDREPATVQRVRQLAGLIAHLVVTKTVYGDTIAMTERRHEMALAAELRWAFLPPLTFISDRIAVAGALQPAYTVAGDAFDYAINGDRLHLAVFDAMGHGLAASRLANLALVSYRHSRRRGLDLEAVYAAMDDLIRDQYGVDAFVTAQFVTLELETGQIRWINAGHPPPIMLRGGQVGPALVGHTTVPVGLGLQPATVGWGRLEPGDALLFYSDGVVEARSRTGEEFGVERLADLLVRAAASHEPPPEIVRRLTHAVLDHEDGHLDDDATLLLVEWPTR